MTNITITEKGAILNFDVETEAKMAALHLKFAVESARSDERAKILKALTEVVDTIDTQGRECEWAVSGARGGGMRHAAKMMALFIEEQSN